MLDNIKPFDLFNKSWALVTAGPINNHNSMTVSWGELGTLWRKDVATIYIKPCRYTHEFMEANDYFVISFFDEKCHNSLMIMGSNSGRDGNKDELSGLTPISHKKVTIYKEAKVTLICKKIYQHDMVLENIPKEEINTYYKEESPHTMYIGEVIEIIKQ